MGSLNKSSRFSAIAGMLLAAAIGAGRFKAGNTTLRSLGLGAPDQTPSAPNRGRRPGNKAFQRVAAKKRNKAAHRRACRA